MMQRRCLISLMTSLFLMAGSAAYAAEWHECEKAKLRQLDLQQARKQASPSHKRKKSKQGRESAGSSVEQIDEWLWKNCREYAYELRTLEQQRM